ncbi:MAG: tetratricopeptide repeat protein [Spirochaetes bacterium]|nr:tetratricopeptide repeat protein [Spirochaetota bacterium]
MKEALSRTALLLLLLALVTGYTAAAAEDFSRLHHLLRLARKPPGEAGPKDRIYFKDEIVYCTGSSSLAIENNKAADKIAGGDYSGAIAILESALKNSALFFPFRYNLGICYLHLNSLKKSMLHFTKAQAIVPEYAGTYLQMGSIYQLWYRDNEAIECYREALRRNSNELDTYVRIGDLFFNRNQVQLAKKYYDQCLRINPRFNNGLLGRAKAYFKEGEYYRALVVLKSIDTRKQYDRAYHYYYAESAFKLQDYATASTHYALLLEAKNDRFFLTNSVTLIEHKLNLSNRFIEK